jgi:hypothetical protein
MNERVMKLRCPCCSTVVEVPEVLLCDFLVKPKVEKQKIVEIIYDENDVLVR